MKAYKRTQLYNQPIRLTEKQLHEPERILKEFFSWYHLDDFRELLWEWMQVAMTAENSVYETSKERSNLMFFYRNIELLVEAAYVLRQEQDTRKKKKKP